MDLSIKDFAILVAMERNPKISIQELSNMLNLSRKTISHRLRKLKDPIKGIIRKTKAYVLPEGLRLKRTYVLFSVSSPRQIKFLQDLADIHPYTNYYAPMYGENFGMFTIFDLPPSAKNILKEFLQYFKDAKKIDDFKIYPSTGLRTYSIMNLNHYNVQMAKWNFSWKEWFKDLNEFDSELPEPHKNSEDILSKIKPTHLQLLRDLTINADIKQTAIMERYNLSKAEASRQYNFVRKNFVSIFVLAYDRSIFDIVETSLVLGHAKKEKIAKLYNKFKAQPPPFQMSLDIAEDNNFLFWGRMTPAQSIEFSFNLWEYCSSVSVFRLNVNKSMSYYFYPENFDFKKKVWKKTRDYLFVKPIKELKKKTKNKTKCIN